MRLGKTIAGFCALWVISACSLPVGYLKFPVAARAPVRQLALTGSSTLVAGQCLPLSASLEADEGDNASYSQSQSVVFSSSLGGSFYSDALCTVSVTSLEIASGASAVGFYFRDLYAESPVVSATISKVTATLGLTVSAAPVSALWITAPSLSSQALQGSAQLAAGSCGGAFTVTSVDRYGNPADVPSDTSIGLLGAGAGRYYSDAKCTASTSSLVVPAGEHSANFYFLDAVAQGVTLSATASGYASGYASVAILPAAPSSIVLSGPSSVLVSTCIGLEVQAMDAFANLAPLVAATPITLSGGSFFVDSACTKPGSVTIQAGQSSQAVYFKGAIVQGLLLEAQAASLAPGYLSLLVKAGFPSQFAVDGWRALGAGVCSAPYTITAKDAQGNIAQVPSNTTLTLGGSGKGYFFKDPACATPITSVTLTAGSSTVSYYFSDASVENLTMTVAAIGYSPGSLPVVVQPTPASLQLVLSGPASVTAGSCSAGYSVTTFSAGVPTGVSSPTPIFLSQTGNAGFFSDASCSTPISTVTIGTGANNQTFYMKDSLAENVTLLVSAPGLDSGSYAVVVQTASPMRLSLRGPALVTAGTCSQALTVTTLDAFGNPSAVAAATQVSLTGAGSGSYYSNASCTSAVSSIPISAGQSASAAFYFMDNSAQSITVSASATGLSTATMLITVVPGPASQLALSGPPSIFVGTCRSYSIFTKDSQGNLANVSANTNVPLTGAGSGAFYSDAACTSAVTAVTVMSNTNTQSFYFKDGTVETVTLQAAATGLSGTSLGVLVSAGGPPLNAHLVLGETSYGFGNVGILSSATHTVSVSNTGSLAATAIAVSGLSGAYSSATSCGSSLSAGGSCNITITFAPSAVGTNNQTFSVAYNSGSTPLSVTEDLSGAGVAAPPTLSFSGASGTTGTVNLAMSVSPTTLNNNGAAVTACGVKAGTPALPTGLSVNNSTCVISGTPAATLAATTFTLAATNSAGTSVDATVTLTITAGVPTLSYAGSAGTSGSVNHPMNVSPTTLNGNGAAVTSCGIKVGSANAGSFPGTLSVNNSTCVISGTPTATLAATPFTLVATNAAGTSADATVTLTIVASTVSASQSRVVASPSSVLADGVSASTITVTLLDASANPVSGKTVSLAAGSGSSTISAISATTNASGQATFAVKDASVETVTYTATDLTETVTVMATASVAFAAILAVTTNHDGSHACALAASGSVYCWGANWNGQLGNNSATQPATPVQVVGVGGSGYLSSIVNLSAGANHTCAVSSAGNVYCWGVNSNGQLGNGTTNSSGTPVKVVGVGGSGFLSGITSVSAGTIHTCAVSSAGNVYCWGDDADDELGNTAPAQSGTPVEVEGVGGSGNLSGVTKVSAADQHTCALLSSGGVACWGNNTFGQLGTGTISPPSFSPIPVVGVGGSGTLSGIVSLAAGNGHTCAVTSTGGVACWGAGGSGQLGSNTTSNSNQPVQVVGTSGPGPLGGITSVAAGNAHSCAVSSAGNVYCWGLRGQGNLGDGLNTGQANRPVQVLGVGATGNLSGISGVAAGSAQTCSYSTLGNVFCWGTNGSGQLGDPLVTSSATPVETMVQGLGRGSGFFSLFVTTPVLLALDATGDSVCAASSAGGVDCWGYNIHGQLGNNSINDSSTPVQVVGVGGSGSLSGIVSLSSGEQHACGLSSSGNVYCWGTNQNGELGINSQAGASSPPVEVLGVGASGNLSGVVGISSGTYYTCAVSAAGNVYCWGNNNYGQLGNNSTTNSPVPVQVLGVGGSGNLSGIVGVAAGDQHACALSSSGNVYCWGEGIYGQLGNNATNSSSTPVQVAGVGGSGNLSGMVSVVAGVDHSCALSSGGNVFCWGFNSNGQLGVTSGNSIFDTPVEVLGVGGSGHLGGIVGLAAGNSSSCAVSTAGTAYCWGYGKDGKLGDNSTATSSNTPMPVVGVGGSGNLSGIVSLTVGNVSTCALTSAGNVYCWGSNTYGNLGNSTTTTSLTPVEVLGVGGTGVLSGI